MKNVICIIINCAAMLFDNESSANQVLLSMSDPFGLDMTMEEAIKNSNE